MGPCLGRNDQQYSKCDICQQDYNKTDHKKMTCHNMHTFCRDCILKSKKQFKCPVCRIQIKQAYSNNLYDKQQIPISPITKSKSLFKSKQSSIIYSHRFSQNTPNYQQILQQALYQPRKIPQKQQSKQPEVKREQKQIQEIGLYHQTSCWLDLPPQKKSAYTFAVIIQTIMALINLYYYLTTPNSICMDRPDNFAILGIKFIVIRPWVLGVTILESAIILQSLLVIVLFKSSLMSQKCLERWQKQLKMLWGIKLLVWCGMQIWMVGNIMLNYCPDETIIFGMFSAFLNGILLLILVTKTIFC